MKCEICKKNNGRKYKSEVFDTICLCDKCVKELGGKKKAVEAYEIGNVVFVK